MPSKLPAGWVKTTLAEVCLPVSNIWPEDAPDVEFTYFDIGGIDNVHNRIAAPKAVVGRAAPSRARQAVRRGDILFSNVRTYLRNVAIIDQDYANPVASTGFSVIRPATGVSSEFLLFQILSDRFLNRLHDLQSGTSYPAVRSSDVFAQPVLLPPTATQDRIAKKLRTALAAIEKAEQAALNARGRLDQYRATLLQEAVTGQLTREWRRNSRRPRASDTAKARLARLLAARAVPSSESRHDKSLTPDIGGLPPLPSHWVWTRLGQIGEVIGGLTKNPRRARLRLKLPYLRVANVYANELRLDDVGRIGVERAELDRLLLNKNDLVIVEGKLESPDVVEIR